jgi:hypothetical protein
VTAQSGNWAFAEVIAAIDTSAVAIMVLNVVIVVVRVVMCGKLAIAIAASSLRTFPGDFLDKSYIGVASDNAHRVNITPARRAQKAAVMALIVDPALRGRPLF